MSLGKFQLQIAFRSDDVRMLSLWQILDRLYTKTEAMGDRLQGFKSTILQAYPMHIYTDMQ